MERLKVVIFIILPVCAVVCGPNLSNKLLAQISDECQQHLVKLASIVNEHKKCAQLLTREKAKFEQLAGRQNNLSDEEKAEFQRLRTQVLQLQNKKKELFNAIERKSDHVLNHCSELTEGHSN